MTTENYPIGPQLLPDGSISFRIWAPAVSSAQLILQQNEKFDTYDLAQSENGFFSTKVDNASIAMRYGFKLGDDPKIYPDPASRFQPDGPLEMSQITDPNYFKWSDHKWPGPDPDNLVLYEMHIGTFTKEGTYRAAAAELKNLASLGVKVIELMPVAEFDGDFGWGYDGICLFAPTHIYGEPDDFKFLINEAHRCGLGIILDVVYNHLGPGSWYLKKFSPHYFTSKYSNEWGEALNFDGSHSGPVREFFIANAVYWAKEFHLDGLRIDATQQIFDDSPVNIMKELTDEFRMAAMPRRVLMVGENEPQDVDLMQNKGIDCLWNDDFHRSAMVALTGRKEAYYTDYTGKPQEFISGAKYGYLFQGQYYYWQKKTRGSVSANLSHRLIHYLQNHDQVANTCNGQRISKLTSPASLRAMTGFFLLSPQVPLIFQGQEFASSAPFIFFARHTYPQINESSARGRARFLSQFPSIKHVDGPLVPPPSDPQGYLNCKLDHSERQKHESWYRLHSDLLSIRNSDPVFFKSNRICIDGAVLGDDLFILRYFGIDCGDRLMIVNLGSDVFLPSISDPFSVPPDNSVWELVWYSENPLYGGSGAVPLNPAQSWAISARCTYFLSSIKS